MAIRVAIVDDSPLIRQVLVDFVSSQPDMEVVGIGRDGEEAVQIARTVKPDVMTLDVEMPRQTGLEALAQIMQEAPLPVIMVSTLTAQGATATLEALEKGAYDFVCKPRNGSFIALREVQAAILEKIRHAQHARFGKPQEQRVVAMSAPAVAKTDKVVLIASSTGGPRALAALFEGLPKGFSAPILIVQHMPAGFTESFAKRLDRIGTVPCKEAVGGDSIIPGLALVAPGGKHMVVSPKGTIDLTDEPAMHGVKPAADYLFHSAVAAYGSRCIAAVLTGMGKDGAEGALAVRQAGGIVLGESEQSCTIYGMPKAAKAIGAVHLEVPIHEMAHALVASLSGRKAHAS